MSSTCLRTLSPIRHEVRYCKETSRLYKFEFRTTVVHPLIAIEHAQHYDCASNVRLIAAVCLYTGGTRERVAYLELQANWVLAVLALCRRNDTSRHAQLNSVL